MHEAGHLLMMIFGTTVSFLGGTLVQILIPVICGLVLVLQQNDWFGGGVCAWWLGENLVNIGKYLTDAPYEALPLIGGEHDWAYLFGQWGLISHSSLIGHFVINLGLLIMILALIWLILQLVINPRPTTET
jgi:hypothetical protein